MDLGRLRQELRHKWHLLRELPLYSGSFRNWQSIWHAQWTHQRLPPLELRDGFILHHGPEDLPIYLYLEIFVSDSYLERSFYRPKPSHTVIDIGANIGYFALRLQQLAPGITVHCFEPGSAARQKLSQNIAQNRLTRVHVYPHAVFDREGELLLHHGAHCTQHHSLFDNAAVHPSGEPVPTLTLTRALDLCNATHVDLLKIDVEGSEIEILEAAPPELFSRLPRIVLETHDRIRTGCHTRVTRLLHNHGYHLRSQELAPGLGLIQATRRGAA